MQQLFFGHPETPLFGVYHEPKKSVGSGKAVLICPPIGQEYIRTHWSLRLLANQLSRRGIHVFRFDYHGFGDSAGNPEQVDDLNIWNNNIRSAIEKLKELSGVQSVMVLGQRLGGLLAAQVQWSLRTSTRCSFGSRYWMEPYIYLSYAKCTKRWLTFGSTKQKPFPTESLKRSSVSNTLGRCWNNSSRQSSIVRLWSSLSLSWIGSQMKSFFPIANGRYGKSVWTSNLNSWTQFAELETAFLRPEQTRTIVSHVDQMFDRLESFGVLESALSGAK